MKTAVFPGSFDPFTRGHESVVRKALPLFDRVIIAIGVNSTKTSLFDLEHRKTWIESTFASDEQVDVQTFEGLTIDFCKKHGAHFILRGLRNAIDFSYEQNIAQMNQAMASDVLSVFIMCDPEYAAINSSIVREIYRNGGDVSSFLPTAIQIDEH